MRRVIVTVQWGSDGRARDLEVPAEVESHRLSELIARALRWNEEGEGDHAGYEIEAYPPGRTLGPRESLADAGVWDGSWLVLRPAGSGPLGTQEPGRRGVVPPPGPSGSPEMPGPTPSPVSGWRPLGIEMPAGPGPGEPKSTSPFAWKQLDTEAGAGKGD